VASTYILIDTTLIGEMSNKPWMKKRRTPSWVVALYDRDAIAVSPILVDIERAVLCNVLDVVMELVNVQHPQLGISFIETDLTLGELQDHLRKFIFIKTEDDEELTLRFADSVVLATLSTILVTEQWSSIVAPFKSWKIHGRDGKLKPLPIFAAENKSKPPLLLSDAQIALLGSAMKTDQLLSNLRRMRPGSAADYSTQKAFEYADRARQIWLSAGHEEDTELLLFVRDVFDTDGRLLHHIALSKVLTQTDPTLRRRDLLRIAKS
jgi:hypothetical protein